MDDEVSQVTSCQGRSVLFCLFEQEFYIAGVQRHAKRRETCLVLAYLSSAQFASWPVSASPTCFLSKGALHIGYGKVRVDPGAIRWITQPSCAMNSTFLGMVGMEGGEENSDAHTGASHGQPASYYPPLFNSHPPTHHPLSLLSFFRRLPMEKTHCGGEMSSWDLPRVCFCISPPSSHLCLRQYHRMCAH